MTVEPRLSGVCCCMHGFIALVPGLLIFGKNQEAGVAFYLHKEAI